MGTQARLPFLIFFPILICTKIERELLRDKLLSMFDHGYKSYMKYAFPADELMPLSCKGRYRGSEDFRGDIDEVLGNFSMTLIDTLDTLAIMGKVDDFNQAVKLVLNQVHFNTDVTVSVFEVNIRVLGGLLGAHYFAEFYKNSSVNSVLSWYNGELLLLATDIGEKLLTAFDSATGLPYPRINLVKCKNNSEFKSVADRVTCTACAGTMLLEFAALSRLTGNPVFEAKAKKAMDFLWLRRDNVTDLIGTAINVDNGQWHVLDSSIGAGIDSYYEYLLKGYFLLGDKEYLDRFNAHYKGVMKYVKNQHYYQTVKMDDPTKRTKNFMDSLHAFWPSLQILIGDLKCAVELHEYLLQVIKKNTFLPEAFLPDMQAYWPYHFLRPEFVESTYFLYRATKDPYYLEVGRMILENIENYARVECGFAAISDVRTHELQDRMDSFVLSETFKYLYLLFEDSDNLPFDINKFIFTTEAHFLPFDLSLQPNMSDADDRLRNAFSSVHAYGGDDISLLEYLQKLRNHSRKSDAQECALDSELPNNTLDLSSLDDIDFHNKFHQSLLRNSGILVLNSHTGQSQLVFSAAMAKSVKHAIAGQKFMIGMKSLMDGFLSEQSNLSVSVILLTSPFNGNFRVDGILGRFSPKSEGQFGIVGKLVMARPFLACDSLFNAPELAGNVVLVSRGQCEFITKASNVQKAKAIAGLVVDTNSKDGTETVVMSGNGTDIRIPFLLVSNKDGQRLMDIAHDSVYAFIGRPHQLVDTLCSQQAFVRKWLASQYETHEINRHLLEYYDKCSLNSSLWKMVIDKCLHLFPEIYHVVVYRNGYDSVIYSLPFGLELTSFRNGTIDVDVHGSFHTCSSYSFSLWAHMINSYFPLPAETVRTLYELFAWKYCGRIKSSFENLSNVISDFIKVRIQFRSEIPYLEKRVVYRKKVK